MRTAFWLYLFSFIAIFDLHAQYPILTPFAVSLGAAPSFIGLMMGLYSITHLPGNVIAGWSVDRFGSRVFIVLSLLAAGIVLLLQSRVDDPWQLLVLRSISGFVLAFLSPACMALLARITADRVLQGKLMAGNGLVHTLASVVSPAAGALLVARLGFELSFFALGCLLIATSICALLFIRDIRPPATADGATGSYGVQDAHFAANTGSHAQNSRPPEAADNAVQPSGIVDAAVQSPGVIIKIKTGPPHPGASPQGAIHRPPSYAPLAGKHAPQNGTLPLSGTHAQPAGSQQSPAKQNGPLPPLNGTQAQKTGTMPSLAGTGAQPTGSQQSPAGTPAPQTAAHAPQPPGAADDPPLPWLVYVLPIAMSCAQGILSFELPMLALHGNGIMHTGLLFSVLSLGSLVTLSMMFLNRYSSLRRTMAGALTLALAYFTAAVGDMIPLAALLFIIGMAKGVIYPAMSTLLIELTGSAKYGRTFSVLSIAYSVGAFLGPLAAGYIRDAISPYFLAFLVLMTGAILLPLAGARRLHAASPRIG